VVQAKPLKRKSSGWVYFVQWASTPWMVKIGFSSSPRDRFASFLTSSPDTLVVLKIFEGNIDDEKDLHEKFAACRDKREWFRLSPSLKKYLQEEAICQTLEAKTKFGNGTEDDIKWMPMRPDTSALLDAMQKEKRLPRFVKTARLYTLWAINDLDACDFFATSNAVITHDANTGIYKAKTIYNQLMDLADEGLIEKRDNKSFKVTEMGNLELDNVEAEHSQSRPMKTRSLKLR
jgi:hypothetical protein